MKVKRANRLMSIIDKIWVIHLQKVNILSMIGIYDKYFHFIPVIMVLYIYKYWFKMLKRLRFTPLIKALASSTNCTMPGNLTCSRHATYLHTIYVKSHDIHILFTIQILDLFNEIDNKYNFLFTFMFLNEISDSDVLGLLKSL